MIDVHGLEGCSPALAVLSACCSAGGDMNAADGIVGLQRAFLVAGCLSLVVSPFNVDDAATLKLMGVFYDRLFAGEDTAQALRSAMLQAIVDDPDPSHWSTFVVVGRAVHLNSIHAFLAGAGLAHLVPKFDDAEIRDLDDLTALTAEELEEDLDDLSLDPEDRAKLVAHLCAPEDSHTSAQELPLAEEMEFFSSKSHLPEIVFQSLPLGTLGLLASTTRSFHQQLQACLAAAAQVLHDPHGFSLPCPGLPCTHMQSSRWSDLRDELSVLGPRIPAVVACWSASAGFRSFGGVSTVHSPVRLPETDSDAPSEGKPTIVVQLRAEDVAWDCFFRGRLSLCEISAVLSLQCSIDDAGGQGEACVLCMVVTTAGTLELWSSRVCSYPAWEHRAVARGHTLAELQQKAPVAYNSLFPGKCISEEAGTEEDAAAEANEEDASPSEGLDLSQQWDATEGTTMTTINSSSLSLMDWDSINMSGERLLCHTPEEVEEIYDGLASVLDVNTGGTFAPAQPLPKSIVVKVVPDADCAEPTFCEGARESQTLSIPMSYDLARQINEASGHDWESQNAIFPALLKAFPGLGVALTGEWRNLDDNG
eukprot:TRINITY_DN13577_c0_g2_i1.p1 TRINITY_DN13577_c0_g2~~TRINITY_DN13577_c0_g2_i1.p1  ORF type:complete len:592 (+),score=110.72 TRINITY_DN13577_c0_g2_i1:431-2206(+)